MVLSAASAARAALVSGEVDFAWNLQVEAEVLQQMESEGDGLLVPIASANVERITVNFADPNTEVNGARSRSPACPKSPQLAGSTRSIALSGAASSAIRARTCPIVSSGTLRPRTSDRARRIFQSSLASPGGNTASLPRCSRPSVLTQLAFFSV